MHAHVLMVKIDFCVSHILNPCMITFINYFNYSYKLEKVIFFSNCYTKESCETKYIPT